MVTGLFGTVAAVFNIPLVDQLALYAWTNINQLFYISSLFSTLGESSPLPEGWGTQAVVITGAILLIKLLWDASNDLEDSIDDS
ncbi:hypothetical protein DVK05_06025 [Halorubrum sp. Atlit-8R]|uniref:Uncharacterized protein n=1 Tax=Halorubrum tropicale TaxID=1765655 RepID=A0A0M9AJF2_9EURY|nr:hypothetical protein AMR74_16600 [Halorubrum tropicale]RLM66795.1 hypothetical protein DVK08_13045 [Halorubrum sp. Atlit-9R]RLM81617.1 hypothetical protein DVK05_06025 [Halorubrum sp. Atlit-8R]TKX50011.1 hypothetical protein EXE49_09210 [Halorubrum sp. ASP121]